MADYFDQQPNFVNPAYASPEQLATQRAYADALMKRSSGNVNRPAGAIANMVDALTAGLTRNNANTIQQQAAEGNAHDATGIIAALQRGEKPDAATMAHLYANPLSSPEQRDFVGKLITPQAMTSPFGQPGYGSPGTGVNAPPINGAFQPGAPMSQSTPDASQTFVNPAPAQRAAPVAAPRPGVGGVFGGISKPVGWDQNNVTPQALGSGGGARVPGAGSPPASAPAAPISGTSFGGYAPPPGALEALAARGRDLSFQRGQNESQVGFMKQDADAANKATAVQRVASVMLDDLNAHPLNMGPTAQTLTSFQKVLAQHAPGLLSDEQIKSIASQDSFQKSAAQLVNIMTEGGAGGTDAHLLNNMHSVPGEANSREGAKALLKMTLDVAAQQQALRSYAGPAKSGPEYEAKKREFYADPANRIVNPITGNPIAQDVSQQNQKTASSAYEKTATNPQTGAKIGFRNGKWEQINK
jgi:hypothetical protein